MRKIRFIFLFSILSFLIFPHSYAADLKKAGYERILTIFTDINKFYRSSGSEKEIRNYVEKYITSREPKAKSQVDEMGNLLIQIPASKNAKHASPVSLQGHLDMVLDVSPEVKKKLPHENMDHYFKNGVTVVYENGYGKAPNADSSIGADNGIGLAIMMVLATEPDLVHPPLELLFTVSEEKGLVGAKNLQLPITAKQMINLDSFYYGIITNSCMGSKRLDVKTVLAPMKSLPTETAWKTVQIKLDGLKGGHSGEDIYKNRLNAATLLVDLLDSLQKKSGASLLSAQAGDVDVFNKIPSQFQLNILVTESNLSKTNEILENFKKELAKKIKTSLQHKAYADEEGFGEDVAAVNFEYTSTDTDLKQNPILPDDSAVQNVLKKIRATPNGILTKNPSASKGIETSSNFGFIRIQPNEEKTIQFHAGWMPRSFKNRSLEGFQKSLESKFSSKVGISGNSVTITIPSESPAWEGDTKSKLLKKFQTYLKSNKQAPFKIEGTLGGMEVTWFLKKFPNLDVISIGPNIRDAHSHRENFELKSVENLYDVLIGFLAQEAK